MNYLTKPKLYNLGFLLNDKESRIKQGLMPQTISSDCFQDINEKKLRLNPYFNNPLFPIRGLYVDYNVEPKSSNAYYFKNIKNA